MLFDGDDFVRSGSKTDFFGVLKAAFVFGVWVRVVKVVAAVEEIGAVHQFRQSAVRKRCLPQAGVGARLVEGDGIK